MIIGKIIIIKVLIKREPLVLQELGALYRKKKSKKRLEQYNTNTAITS